MEAGRGRLLVFNCHEAWVYQLGLLGYDLDIICGLPGRYTRDWDRHMRPVPARARLIGLEQARASPERYACIIAHNPTDLLDVRDRPEARILVLHLTVQARIVEEHSRLRAEQAKQILHRYVQLTATHVIAVTRFKGLSWGFGEDVVSCAFDPADYTPSTCETACGLRIANFIQGRRTFLHWSFHEQAFGGLPIRLVGHNPDMAGVAPSRDWDHVKDLLRTSRFYIHTAHPDLEDGYNMATVEAMAAGLPVLGNRHPTSVVEHGVNGFVSDDPAELRACAQRLLEDRDLALQMGRQARITAQQRFTVEAFRSGMERAIATAQAKRAALHTHGTHAPTMPGTGSADTKGYDSASRLETRIVDLPQPTGDASSSVQSERDEGRTGAPR